MKRRVADIIMESLVEHGITDCFAVVGGGAMFLDNALALNDNITKYFNHHEQACAMAAEAYARTCGKMAAVCVTSGPGATNTLTGVMGAYVDSLPLIVLSGQVRYAISVPQSGLPLRYRGIQEYEIIKSVKSMTKYALMLTDPLSVKREIHNAIQIAMEGRRGPVWLDVPQDIQSAEVEEDDLYPVEEYTVEREPVDYAKLIKTLENAKRPCIVTGSAIRTADLHAEFMEFADRMQIPVVGGGAANDVMDRNHPLFSGMTGTRSGNFILQNADVILTLGNSMGFKQTGFNQEGFAPNATIIMVDADKNESLKPGLRIAQFVHRDLRDFFREMAALSVNVQVRKKWADYCAMLKERFYEFEALQDLDMNSRVNFYQFWEVLDKYAKPGTIFALGNNSGNTPALMRNVTNGHRLLTNFNCGSMGYDIPCAVGASVAAKTDVICSTGDGSFMMNMQELQTIRHYNLPVKIAVLCNDGYGTIRQTCKNFFGGKELGCTKESGISFPDFKLLAEAFGFKYMHCSTHAELEDSIKEFVNAEGHVFMTVDQLLDNPIIPRVMSRLDENGKMQTPAMHDMAPFLDKEDVENLMISHHDED